MSADLLRRAAAKLREHAEKTTPDWRHEDGRIRTPDMPHLLGIKGKDPALAIYRRTDDAEYSVLMHPPVALALADWLDEIVADHEINFPYQRVFALARAILREEATS